MSASGPARQIVVVGGGVAAFSAISELRSRGFDGAITLLSPEGLPYDRPTLSKGYLLGTEDATKIRLAPEAWYAERSIELVPERAVALRPAEGAVELDGGRRLPADRVLLATGGVPRCLGVPGGEAAHTLRDLADSDALRRALAPGARVAVVGAGLIGAEVASAAVVLGAEATLIDPVDPPLVPAVGEALARRLHAMHAERGIRTIVGAPVGIEAHDGAAPGSAYSVRFADGSTVAADAVVAGIGILPDTALAEAAGLEAEGGVIVDDTGATSNPAVFAAGDTCRRRAGDGTLARRSEHWEAAVHSGQVAAAGMLGAEPPQFGAPWLWSDRHGVHVEAVGTLDERHAPGARTVLRMVDGVPQAAFLLAADGHLLGCSAVDLPLVVRAARRIIDRGIVPDPDALADPSADPRKLTR
ncbi:FAD-dependent oxidoreductase [Sinomonas sp. ASV322]|uniref:NAD(P)/FAD-dependent oxidoreductase n=1 Tax=Sinomonas sp. ASV322 TaxID=3041920 RepID=UPI0027DBB14B|nr:FAD-dependent oxidoreductase [Sinomonas sp. ASV322]MDQ4502883.1 FAD-dependent oxidoreductase [Sinomonas sp. ASV322]